MDQECCWRAWAGKLQGLAASVLVVCCKQRCAHVTARMLVDTPADCGPPAAVTTDLRDGWVSLGSVLLRPKPLGARKVCVIKLIVVSVACWLARLIVAWPVLILPQQRAPTTTVQPHVDGLGALKCF